MRILVLEHLLPVPMDSGAKLRSYCTLKALASRHELMMLSYVRTDEERAHLSDLRDICEPVELIPLARSRFRDGRDALSCLAMGKSFIITRDFRVQMLRALERAIADFRPDVIHVDHLQMAQFIGSDSACATVLDQHNVESTIIRRIAQTVRNPLARAYAGIEWPKLQRFELDACGRCDLVVTVSEEDKAELRRQRPTLNNIEVLAIGIDTDRFAPVDRNPNSRDVLFLGTMYWPPNVDCVHYFYSEILPIVRKSVPDCTFTIAGQRPEKSVVALGGDPAVQVTGYVDDVREVAANCGAFVVPLQAGSGVRVKILNAMSMGLPVVSTMVGAEGIEAVDGRHLLIADGPEQFAQAVVRVLSDPELASTLGRNARQLACEKYSWETVGTRALELYETHVAPRVRTRP
jgi:glycosyltransferase involved in cell wall biosynthesis